MLNMKRLSIIIMVALCHLAYCAQPNLIEDKERRLIVGFDPFNDVDLMCEFASDDQITKGKPHISRDCVDKNIDVVMYKNGKKYRPFFAFSAGVNGFLLTCDIPPNLTFLNCSNSNFIVYSKCEYKCNGGLVTKFSTLECLPAGSWGNLTTVFNTNQLPCVSPVQNDKHGIVETQDNYNKYYIAAGFFLLFLIVCVVLQCCIQRKKKPNFPTGVWSLCFEVFYRYNDEADAQVEERLRNTGCLILCSEHCKREKNETRVVVEDNIDSGKDIERPMLPEGFGELPTQYGDCSTSTNEVIHFSNSVCTTNVRLLRNQNEKFMSCLCDEIDYIHSNDDEPNMMKLAMKHLDRLGLSKKGVRNRQENPQRFKKNLTKPAELWIHIFAEHNFLMSELVDFFKESPNAKDLLLKYHSDCDFCNSL